MQVGYSRLAGTREATMPAQQHIFAAALLDPDRAVPAGLTSHSSPCVQKRFAVYRNNVVVGLVNALRARFPATERIVGAEFFFGMARVFVAAHPPRTKILAEYGDDFPGFIAAFAPAAELSYLADVARLEAARTRAWHAADADPLAPEAFAALAPEKIATLRFTLHPSMQIVRSRHPVVTVWAMNSGECPLGPIDENEAEDALIARPHLDVQVRLLPPGGAAFLAALSAGATLADAAHAAAADDACFDLTANLAGLLSFGLVADFSLSDRPEGTPS
jgi:hypothetical protein